MPELYSGTMYVMLARDPAAAVAEWRYARETWAMAHHILPKRAYFGQRAYELMMAADKAGRLADGYVPSVLDHRIGEWNYMLCAEG
jgi:hypothetical protein